jgi:hypothetical protein
VTPALQRGRGVNQYNQAIMETRRAIFPILALIAAASVYAIAGEHDNASMTPLATPPAQGHPDVLFYSDLGPEQIDVSAYPIQQRRNYAVYARACSRCHSLARSISAPYTSRGWWEFYMTGMRMRGGVAGRPFSREEIKSVLDFLEYDSHVRKIQHAAAFGKSSEELKLRFDALVDQHMSDLQNNTQLRLQP